MKMNNSGNSKWVCVNTTVTADFFTVGKIYTFNLFSTKTTQDNTGHWWNLTPDEFAPQVKFKELTFPVYYEQVLLLRRESNQRSWD